MVVVLLEFALSFPGTVRVCSFVPGGLFIFSHILSNNLRLQAYVQGEVFRRQREQEVIVRVLKSLLVPSLRPLRGSVNPGQMIASRRHATPPGKRHSGRSLSSNLLLSFNCVNGPPLSDIMI